MEKPARDAGSANTRNATTGRDSATKALRQPLSPFELQQLNNIQATDTANTVTTVEIERSVRGVEEDGDPKLPGALDASSASYEVDFG